MSGASELEITITDILKGRPASAETISVITGLPSNLILMKLRKLEKWKVVKPITKKEMIIWGLASD